MAKPELIIVKIGGNVIDNPLALDRFLLDLSKLEGEKLLVHGGGKIATEIASRLGIVANMVDGRRITDQPMLEVVTMVYGGLVNKNIVAKLQGKGVNAIGLTGADGNSLLCTKRPVKEVDYGFVGDLKAVNTSFFTQLILTGVMPVVAPLSHDGEGNMLNINADTVATSLAKALSAEFTVRLLYCFELKGVLSDFEDKNSVIPSIDFTNYQLLKQNGIISKGMIPKLDNSFNAIQSGVSEVVICHSDDLLKVAKREPAGTVLS